MNLLEGYLDQGYSIYVDNFYTSPTLGSHLFDHSTHITGTLDRTRVGVPDEVKDLWANMSHRATTRGSGGYVRVGSLVYAVWKDTKCIVVMSTSHPGHSMNTVLRNCKDSDGKHQKIPVPIPEPVYQYNRYMGGVDCSDQLIKYYNVLRQTKKYWKTLFLHSIDIAVVNAYLLHRELVEKPMSQYEFRESLVRSLTDTCTRPACRQSSDKINIDHRMVKMESMRACVFCKIANKEIHRTTRQCFQCGAPLCFKNRTCFEQWHNRDFKVQRDTWLAQGTKQKTGRPKGSVKPKGRGKRRKKNW